MIGTAPALAKRGRGSRRLLARISGTISGAIFAVLLLGAPLRVRAAEPEPPSEEFLEYLGTIEAEDEDWTIFDASRAPTDSQDPPSSPTSPPKKEKSPPPAGDEP